MAPGVAQPFAVRVVGSSGVASDRKGGERSKEYFSGQTGQHWVFGEADQALSQGSRPILSTREGALGSARPDRTTRLISSALAALGRHSDRTDR
jgi:hypothetical protein